MDLCTEWSPQMAAAKGAALLDSKDPTWAARIDTKTLNLGHFCGCILGQLGGNTPEDFGLTAMARYGSAFDRFAVAGEGGSVENGFMIPSYQHLCGGYRRLTEAWLEEITKRRAKS